MGCVYLVTHGPSGRIYVGQTVNSAAQRWSSHIYEARRTSNCHVDRAIAKYGREAFTVQMLSEHASQADLDIAERVAIIVFSATDKRFGFNTRSGGARGTHSPETRLLMRQVKSNVSQETRSKLRTASLGNQHCLGRKISDEHRAKLVSASRGRVVSEDERKRISAALTGRRASEETKAKLRGRSPWNKGKLASLKHRENLRKSHTGLRQSADTIAKRTASRLKTLALRKNEKEFV